ncbi:nuclear transport factor 2 family protein [Agromyces neolithicus]|uniref:SnoaL-like domain-containing protein n=1 Tax=Agromyces neolithicus TaxID=269420 RepID=A0ABP4Y3B7_9MICO
MTNETTATDAPVSETPANEALVRELMRAIESGEHGDALARFFTDDAEQVEYPSIMRPAGGSRGVQAMLDGSVAGAQMLAEQSYDVLEFIDGGDRAAVRLTWRATTATAIAGLPAGSTLTAHIAQFYEFRDGRIIRQRSYDCYEPLGAASV